MHCHRYHSGYSIEQLETLFGGGQDKYDHFMTTRKRANIILREHGQGCHLGKQMNKCQEMVQLRNNAGEKVIRAGSLYRKDVWDAMPAAKDPDVASRVKPEDRINPANGKVVNPIQSLFRFDSR